MLEVDALILHALDVPSVHILRDGYIEYGIVLECHLDEIDLGMVQIHSTTGHESHRLLTQEL
jgi:hypothetical protein